VQPVPTASSDGGAGSPFSGAGGAGRVFPRSLTHDVANSGHGFAPPASPAHGRRSSIAGRAGRQQQGDAEAGEGEARYAGASGFNLEGRS
jgi:hypothetical protein